ncbi:hypothetical protein SAMN04487891_111109 [Flagellimonas taeanensis]|uniref:Uncharacterized protein n=1 Tax=Flagellimonas taeanensis TaxID=1005926 RepID=A0A1M6W8E5_9FLAO|nr:hypothetical protein [Allomuricauda taeanensis]SFC45458.1 hypothetical protein SAMN04487891_111109 [Allomuricauda taeanensis]SHK89967.1 hypothetical protein SAMN05216293_2200 [Allomuricauda taeanensis]
MTSRLFNDHEADDRIMLKKDKVEVGHWAESLEHIDEEIRMLLALEDRFLNDSALHVELLALQRENTLKSGMLYRYENAMRNAWECDDMACDTYYLNKHEKYRELYMEHLKSYRKLKSKLFSRLLD